MGLKMKLAAGTLAALTLVTVGTEAFARPGHPYYRHRGFNPGAAVAGAVIGAAGLAIAGAAANRYYNGYPAYDYGPAYGGRYGYDYHPGYGYYGPY